MKQKSQRTKQARQAATPKAARSCMRAYTASAAAALHSRRCDEREERTRAARGLASDSTAQPSSPATPPAFKASGCASCHTGCMSSKFCLSGHDATNAFAALITIQNSCAPGVLLNAFRQPGLLTHPLASCASHLQCSIALCHDLCASFPKSMENNVVVMCRSSNPSSPSFQATASPSHAVPAPTHPHFTRSQGAAAALAGGDAPAHADTVQAAAATPALCTPSVQAAAAVATPSAPSPETPHAVRAPLIPSTPSQDLTPLRGERLADALAQAVQAAADAGSDACVEVPDHLRAHLREWAECALNLGCSSASGSFCSHFLGFSTWLDFRTYVYCQICEWALSLLGFIGLLCTHVCRPQHLNAR